MPNGGITLLWLKLMNLFFTILRSVIYVPLFILFFGWIALNVRVFDKKIGIALPQWASIVGIITMTVGAILVLICVAVFVFKGKGTPAIFDPPKEFVAVGPYAY